MNKQNNVKVSKGKVAWVTGAGKGIGRSLAKRLSEEGWIVAASARTKNDLSTLEIDSKPNTLLGFPLDITDAASTLTTVEKIEQDLGNIELVVFNAGTHKPLHIEDFNARVFRDLVEVNLMGTVNGLAEIIPKFIKRKSGHIVVVASLAGYRGLPTSAAYGATKAGVINMCEALKPELDRYGVRLTLINPGFVETPLTAENTFPMPFLISVDKAVEYIMRGLDRGNFEITFPWRFAFLMKLLRILPNWLFFKLTQKLI